VDPLLHRLLSVIQDLSPEELERQKRELLEIVDALRPFHPNGDGDSRHLMLSPREWQVMTMLLEGQRLKEIAIHLDIGVKTVTTHRSRLMRKLGVQDTLGLYRYAIRNGLAAL